jgi:hypothetical protein
VQRVAFESFRDLVKLTWKGLEDEAGLAHIEDEALNLRVQARFRASASAGIPISSSTPSRQVPDLAGEQPQEMDDEDDGGDDDKAEDDMINAADEDAATLDATGTWFGISHFSAQLQRAVVQEEEEAEKDAQFRKKCALCRGPLHESVEAVTQLGI